MTIETKYKSKSGRPGDRFVRSNYPSAGYAYCIRDTDDKRFDVEQRTCDAEDLPEDVRAKADSLSRQAFNYVPWPRLHTGVIDWHAITPLA